MNKQDVTDLFTRWNDALQTRDPQQVTDLYASNAILLPTISNQVRHNHEELTDYFEQFLARGPKGTLKEQNIRIFDELAMNSGVYEFSFDDGAIVSARYSYVYQLINNEWKIIEHHSSAMPE